MSDEFQQFPLPFCLCRSLSHHHCNHHRVWNWEFQLGYWRCWCSWELPLHPGCHVRPVTVLSQADRVLTFTVPSRQIPLADISSMAARYYRGMNEARKNNHEAHSSSSVLKTNRTGTSSAASLGRDFAEVESLKRRQELKKKPVSVEWHRVFWDSVGVCGSCGTVDERRR